MGNRHLIKKRTHAGQLEPAVEKRILIVKLLLKVLEA